MAVLVSSYWVEGEAAEKGVSVSANEVDGRYRSERDANFHNTREFKRFLRSMGETVSDLKFRVRTELLTERLRSKIDVADFVTKWRARTLCLPAYMVSDCGATLHA